VTAAPEADAVAAPEPPLVPDEMDG
jgi:hypothetical protein